MPQKDKEAVDQKPEDAATREQDLEKKPSDGSGKEGEVDWKELLHIEREGRLAAERDRDNYKEGLLSRKRREREEQIDTADLDDADKPITRKDLREVIAPVLIENKFETILVDTVKDPAKRAYVKDLYENRIQRTGTSDSAIRSDIEAALALADSKRISKENEELKRMNDNNRVYVPPADGGGGGGGGGKPPASKTHGWTPEQEEALERRAQSIGLFGDAVVKYKEKAWGELQAGTAFAVKPKPRN